jgi:hypothetical protein
MLPVCYQNAALSIYRILMDIYSKWFSQKSNQRDVYPKVSGHIVVYISESLDGISVLYSFMVLVVSIFLFLPQTKEQRGHPEILRAIIKSTQRGFQEILDLGILHP